MQHRLIRVILWLGLCGTLLSGGCVGGGDGTPDPNGTNSKQAMIDRHNNTRDTYGLPDLMTNQLLTQIAQDQADYIALIGDPVHVDAAGGHVDDRATAIGYPWTHIGENVAFATTASSVYNLWLGSAPHLDNITDANYTDIGVGVATRGLYQYWCVVFGAR